MRAQHCTHASLMGRTPAHSLTRTRSALHTCLAQGKNTRSRAPAQHCTHACQMVRTPTHMRPPSHAPLRTCLAHPLTRTRPRAPAQHCTHGSVFLVVASMPDMLALPTHRATPLPNCWPCQHKYRFTALRSSIPRSNRQEVLLKWRCRDPLRKTIGPASEKGILNDHAFSAREQNVRPLFLFLPMSVNGGQLPLI